MKTEVSDDDFVAKGFQSRLNPGPKINAWTDRYWTRTPGGESLVTLTERFKA